MTYSHICKQCSIPFQSHHKDGKFCSRSCSVTWRNRYGDLQKPKIYSTCLLCGKKFRTEPNKIRRGIAKYCSHSCYAKAMKLDVKRRKFRVSKEELRKLYLDKKLSYKQIAKKLGISRSTIENWVKRFDFPRRDISTATKLAMRDKTVPRIPVRCHHCGKLLYRRPKFISQHKYSFCSRKCFDLGWVGKNNPAWKGGHQPNYGPNWKKQKKKVLERDEYTCQLCNPKNNGKWLEVHHIVSLRDFGLEGYEEANRLDNLITLCHSCHMDIGNHPDKYDNFFDS